MPFAVARTITVDRICQISGDFEGSHEYEAYCWARRAQAAAAFTLWQRVVGGSVPPDRLLILDLFAARDDDAELWRALCDFLRAPLPKAADGSLPPFPHMRYGEDMRLPP